MTEQGTGLSKGVGYVTFSIKEDAESAFERGVVGAHRQREVRFQEDAAVMPVEFGGEVDARRVRPQPH